MPPHPTAHDSLPSAVSAGDYDNGAPLGFSKEHLLSKLRAPPIDADVSQLYQPGWNPGSLNGSASKAWGRTSDSHNQEVDPCWNARGNTKPFDLSNASPEEQEVCECNLCLITCVLAG
jgi:PERQ amino acid-rich with GYF domain-containing protein